MAKARVPLIAFSAHGTLGGTITARARGRQTIIMRPPLHPDANSEAQQAQRTLFQAAVTVWHTLTPEEKAELQSAANQLKITIYNYFLKLFLSGRWEVSVYWGDPALEYSEVDDTTIEEAIAAAIAALSLDPGDSHMVVFPSAYFAIEQGTWGYSTEAGQVLAGGLVNTSNADGDSLSYKIFLPAGTFTLFYFTWQSGNRGILDIDIDGNEVASFDNYSSPAVKNVLHTQAGIVIASAGIKTLTIRVDGKNPSSSDYYVTPALIGFWRTA